MDQRLPCARRKGILSSLHHVESPPGGPVVESLPMLDQEPTGTVHPSQERRERQVYALFGFLGILLLLAGLLPIRMLPDFLRGRPRKERMAMWVSGLIIFLIAAAFTPSDDESQQEVAISILAGDPEDENATAEPDEPTTTTPAPETTVAPTTTTPAPETTVAPTTTAPILTPEEQLSALIVEELGDSNRDMEPKTTVGYAAGNVQITFAADDILTTGLIVAKMEIDTSDVLRLLTESEVPWEFAIIRATFPLLNKFGEASEESVMWHKFTHETADRIVWDKLLPEDVLELAVEAFRHPALSS